MELPDGRLPGEIHRVTEPSQVPGWTVPCTGPLGECTVICGDGLRVGDEECDDANGGDGDDGDGCDVTCVIEEGFLCTGEPSTCSPAALCGDGMLDDGEACDDGGTDADDGCDAACASNR